MNAGMMSSKSDEWETPDWLFEMLNNEFKFTLDAAASPQNTKVPSHYYTKEDDALICPLDTSTWCNPPYGREIFKFVKKATMEAILGKTIVMLVPARTDTKWFLSLAMSAAEFAFIVGRLTFVGAKSAAPFPSVVAILDGSEKDDLPGMGFILNSGLLTPLWLRKKNMHEE